MILNHKKGEFKPCWIETTNHYFPIKLNVSFKVLRWLIHGKNEGSGFSNIDPSLLKVQTQPHTSPEHMNIIGTFKCFYSSWHCEVYAWLCSYKNMILLTMYY